MPGDCGRSRRAARESGAGAGGPIRQRGADAHRPRGEARNGDHDLAARSLQRDEGPGD